MPFQVSVFSIPHNFEYVQYNHNGETTIELSPGSADLLWVLLEVQLVWMVEMDEVWWREAW